MKCLKSPYNFAEIPDSYYDYKNSKVVIVPFPYEKTTFYIQGTKKGPEAILKASRAMELYDEELGNVFEVGICTLESLNVNDKPESMVGIIYKNIKNFQICLAH